MRVRVQLQAQACSAQRPRPSLESVSGCWGWVRCQARSLLLDSLPLDVPLAILLEASSRRLWAQAKKAASKWSGRMSLLSQSWWRVIAKTAPSYGQRTVRA